MVPILCVLCACALCELTSQGSVVPGHSGVGRPLLQEVCEVSPAAFGPQDAGVQSREGGRHDGSPSFAARRRALTIVQHSEAETKRK